MANDNEKDLDGQTVHNGFYGNGQQSGQQHAAKEQNGGGQHLTSVRDVAAPSNGAAATVKGRSKGEKGGSLIGNVLKLRGLSKRPLPTEMGDGRYRQVVQRPGYRADLKTVSMKDIKTLLSIVAAKVKGEMHQDDKTMLMERTIQLVADLPSHSKTQELLTNDFIAKLWNSLDHPPLLYMGNEFKYRQPDGSNNNPLLPKLGAAGTPYSRSCKPHVVPLGAQPDPELVYESVMARGEFKRNPNNVSSILWYWATIIIHDLFSTNHEDGNINDASSYLDLAPLYGSSQEAQDSVRTFADGMLKPDAFADKRLVGNPPGVCVLLIMFNRFHNHVAQNLAAINEGGRFSGPGAQVQGDEAKAAAWKKRDEELFQTARLVTSGLYINITLIDYVRNIINLNRVDTAWTLDPRQEMGTAAGTKDLSESGVGNAVSAEFNLCYRWHSCISEADDRWIQNFYRELLGDDADVNALDLPALLRAVKVLESRVDKDPGRRTFDGLRRGPDGRFSDDELVAALADAIEQPGGSFGARNVPRVMKPVEMLGILRGRRWNLAGLNEFRKHFGLAAYATFEDINSDPAVAGALRNLYQHPDRVELYPGLVAEEAKTPMVPGVGIAPTYTISRVVLSDAVSLVRGDRYYTTDYHPGYLTNWGFREVEYDLDVNHGCSFYKLFLRAFPAHFRHDSIYAHYPMVTPAENRSIMASLKRGHMFSFDRPGRVHPRVAPVVSAAAAEHVLGSPDRYRRVSWDAFGPLMRHDGTGARSMPPANPSPTVPFPDGWLRDVKAFYSATAERLLVGKSYRLGSGAAATACRYVDVVRDVGNLAPGHFAARVFGLPLKTGDNPRGVFSEQELYEALALLAAAAFRDADPAKSFALRAKAREAGARLGGAVETSVRVALSLGVRGLFAGRAPRGDALSAHGAGVVKSLAKAGIKAADITWGLIMPTVSATVLSQAQTFAESLDWYLSAAGEPHRLTIHRVATQEACEETDALLLGYALEGARMAGGGGGGLYREAAAPGSIDDGDGRHVAVGAGSGVLVSLAAAAQDPARFPEPKKVDPRRRPESYPRDEDGCLGGGAGDAALVEMFRAVFRKRNLRRAPGAQGELKRVAREGGACVYLSEEWGTESPFPTSMKVMWDGE